MKRMVGSAFKEGGMNRKVLMIVLALCFLAAGLAVAGGQKEAAAAEKKYLIGCSILDTWEPIMKDYERGWKDAADKLGVEMILVSADADAEKQTAQVEDFITKGVDAIILDTADEVGCVPAVLKANAAKVPIFTTDSIIQGTLDGDPANGEVLAHSFTDNYQGGYNAGKYLAEAIGKKGQVCVMALTTITCIKDRVNGFTDAVKDFPEIEIVPVGNVGFDRESAKTFTQDLLVSYPKIKGIFGAWGGDTGLGAYLALSEAKRTDVKVINFDGIQESRKLIYEGNPILIGDAGQHAYKMMYQSMEIAVEYLKTGKVANKMNNVGITYISKDNLQLVNGAYIVKGDTWEEQMWKNRQ